MSGTEIHVDRQGSLTRAAAVTGGRLTDLYIDRADRPSLQGAVFLGRVERIVPALDGAFVDLGTGKPGLLSAADARGPKGRVERIGTLLRAGQSVIVQVKADALGAKGPTLTMDVTFPGRFLVHAPFGKGVTVSRRIGDAGARAELLERLGAVAVGPGWIARASAAEADPAVLEAEADALALDWKRVEGAGAGSAPRCLHPAPSALTRILVETGARTPKSIVVDDVSLADALTAWCAERAPDLLPRLARQKPPGTLFDEYGLDEAIAELTRPQVPLPGGGSLVIERTEALWAVDVNAGERGNALEVNREAAFELARQLRLRNIGGIVVVDFVNMKSRGDAERLLNALASALDEDPVQAQVYGLSKLGLVEITRARRGAALVDALSD